ncbi:MAG: hypothetical protein IPM79_21455 [Polyangiaceae bacterium]|nr:hypothetical protein [Polyangiaceae bacterium]MBK8940112.1 hypothetical protein [Polyangiaceae bacterium]
MPEATPPTDATALTPGEKKRARRLAAIVFLGLVVTWVCGVTAQIVRQALWPEVLPTPYATCSEGLSALGLALDRARADAEGDLDPDSALARFRNALGPEWGLLSAVRESCQKDNRIGSLDALERLRYAEEHAVRREAASLAALRRQVAKDIAPR